ncbi:hypothetical protein ACH5RR_010776 [Cinchona calisaya]|uniref:Stress-related protein n=1 Tax=Cinchona calisaya TaxID=153742 RepID=A0ABD3AK19_9GENT
MADQSEVKQPSTVTVEGDQTKELKYLDFVRVAAIYMVVCLSSLYEYAKENSGPLKPGVQTVEGTVKTVIGPVYQKFRHVPFELLNFVDRKVDDSIKELDRHVPSVLKQASHQVLLVAHEGREVASEVQRTGLVDTATSIATSVFTKYEPTAKKLYLKYEPLAEQYAVSTWRSLNQLPLFPQVAQLMVPTVAYWCEKYNEVVAYTAKSGYTVSHYMPMVPIEKIAKAFKGAQSGPTVSTNGEPLPVST